MYILEGNIGAGKSTFLKILKKYIPEAVVVPEPINHWKFEIKGQSLLKNFYDKPGRWSYTIEFQTLLARVKEHLKHQKSSHIKIMERSIYSGYYCFAKNGFDSGFLTNIEWEIYNQWFHFLSSSKCQPPKGFIYLKVTPENSFKRVKKRNRNAETNLSLDYLKQVDYYHDKFLIYKNELLPSIKKTPVLILDCNKEFETSTEEQQKLFHKINSFL